MDLDEFGPRNLKASRLSKDEQVRIKTLVGWVRGLYLISPINQPVYKMECHKGFGTFLVQEFILSKVVIFVGCILVGRVSNLRGIVWTSN